MPALRSKSENYVSTTDLECSKPMDTVISHYFAARTATATATPRVSECDEIAANSAAPPAIHYPTAPAERAAYRTKAGKRLTPHQWDVYDFTLTIPKGKVATYKDVASIAGGSPRSVGNALRNNPFNPSVPCHRVIASSLFIGGFFGEWGKDHKTGEKYNEKLHILATEGVFFDDKGHLLSEELVWRPCNVFTGCTPSIP